MKVYNAWLDQKRDAVEAIREGKEPAACTYHHRNVLNMPCGHRVQECVDQGTELGIDEFDKRWHLKRLEDDISMDSDHYSDVHGIKEPNRIVRGSKLKSGSGRDLSGFEHVERMVAAQEMESRSATTISRARHPSQIQTVTKPPAKRVRHCRHCQSTAHGIRRCADHSLLLAQQILDATATRSDADIPSTTGASDPPARSIASTALTPVPCAIAPSKPAEGAIAPSDFHDEERGEGYAEGDAGGVGGSELQPDGDNDDHMEDDWDHEEFDLWAGLDNLDVPFEEFLGRFGGVISNYQ
ncbi:hypothetical protein PsorP6_010363 [Peronosclerospora sorghi]|uniref:Uncharacterized protein n=1 Tax=Peronosclerospora sorghi TaxID=230839 RepID=A0ACC0VWN3_9STRA|nr:hypothetical protein PsorP6_010363 [Peronosclerospora sorghi]